ncbi:MAG: ABC transporter substrate-binding protein [Deltaproteobacteria bacterium]|nr:ABC transporter substrate-binding protein [Deltaproteobacteria bacterium]
MKKLALLPLVTLMLWLMFIGGAQAAETIRIGAIFNTTGGASSIDRPGLLGAELAADEINTRGGYHGKKLVLINIDGESDAVEAKEAAEKLIYRYKVAAIIGLNDPAYALPAGQAAQKAGIPFVTAGATLPTLPDQVGNCMFLAPFGDDAQAQALAHFAHESLKAKTAWILTDSLSDYTRALTGYFKDRFGALAGKTAILAEDQYKTGDTGFSAQIGRLKVLNPKPDVLMVSALPSECGLIVKQLRAAGVNTPIIGGDGLDTPLLLEVGEKAAHDVYFSTHISFDNPRPTVRNFVKAFKKAYGRAPKVAFAALGYDTFRLVYAAIEQAGRAEPQAIRDALAKMKDFHGVTGTISYQPGRRVPTKPVTIIKVVNQKFRFAQEVGPAKP